MNRKSISQKTTHAMLLLCQRTQTLSSSALFIEVSEEDISIKTLLYVEVSKYYTWNTTSKLF